MIFSALRDRRPRNSDSAFCVAEFSHGLFRPWTIDQTQLLPAAVVDYVPADHLAQFVVALAREHLDLSEIVASYKSGLGQPPFDPMLRHEPFHPIAPAPTCLAHDDERWPGSLPSWAQLDVRCSKVTDDPPFAREHGGIRAM